MTVRKRRKQQLVKFVSTALLAALIIVLQTICSVFPIRIGPFTPTLSLIPIAIGAILFGEGVGAFLGAVFGAVVVGAVVSGADIGGHMMFEFNPVATVVVCILKSTLAGLLAALIYRLIVSRSTDKKRIVVGSVAACVVLPLVNTGILVVAMLTIFTQVVSQWMPEGSDSLLIYVIGTVVGINFLFELALNIVLSPAVVSVIRLVGAKLSARSVSAGTD